MHMLESGAAVEPLYVGIGALVAIAALGACLYRVARQHKEGRDPLAGLFDPSTFGERLDRVAARPAFRRPLDPSPLHGQRAQMARLQEIWALDMRSQALADVARVMRAGKDREHAPVEVIDAATTIEPCEWEEVRLLAPPASRAA